MSTAADTALSTDPPRPAALDERRVLGLAETTANGEAAVAATWRSDGPQAPALALPAAIGRYQVVRSLGAGGMGEVVLARDPELDRQVAIKLLRASKAAGDAQVRLLREAQAMARLSHPNVVQIHDVGLAGDRVFLAMELVEGETLAQWLAAGPRAWRDVVRVFVEAGRGLAAAHAAGLVHRDFKPDNVLIGRDGRVRVADFGLARGERDAGDERAANFGERPLLVHTLTATGVIMGTPMYMSPEQHLGEPAGPASDIFSFSVALHEGLHGARPFAGDTLPALAASVLEGRVAAPPAGREVPAWLAAVVRRGLAREPAERWPDFPALLAALDRDPARARRRWFAGLGLGLGAAALGATLQASQAAAACTGGDLESVWGPARAATARARLSEEAGERAVAGLQAYSEAWRAQHLEACEQHRRGEASAALLDARMRCLDRRREALAEAVDVITAGDEAAAREAPAVVARLAPLAACADADALTREVAPPGDPGVAAAVADVEHRLARARVQADAGRPALARQAMTAARREAEALAHPPLVAAAWLAEGRAAFEAGTFEHAAEALAAAFVQATAAGDDALVAEARARQLFLDGLMGRAAEALAAAPHAEALVTRLGDRRDLAALLANNLGVVRHAGGDVAGARADFTRALALSQDDPRTLAIDRAGYLKNAAMVAEDMSERTGLYDQAASLLDRALGPAHPNVLYLAYARAREADGPAAAVALLTPMIARLLAVRAAHHDACVEPLYLLAQAHAELGDQAAALARLADARTCLEGPFTAENEAPVAALRDLLDGQRQRLAGDAAAAAATLARAEAAYAPHAAVPGVAARLADVRLALARVHLDAGRPEQARDLLTRVVDELADPRHGDWLARLQLARARDLLAAGPR
ncbi:MAG: serine/threonine protein kinase [Myxococcales bacterium]|nr:serine/threonine protein kinase [Myxococcales bacterium]